jgi:hypothetical protein
MTTNFFGSSVTGALYQDMNIHNRQFNVNTNHPLITNSQEYMYLKKFISIHSEDRDILKYKNSSFFEIELPEDLLNVASIRLLQWTFPANYNTFSLSNGNVLFTFKINNPYNPGANNLADEYSQRIFEALWMNYDTEYTFNIEDGFYNPSQMSTEMTNKLNATVSAKIRQYFTEKGWNDTLKEFNLNGGYNRFIVVYNSVSCKLWYGNNSDGFVITTESGVLTNVISEKACSNGRSRVPDSTSYGLPSYLGLSRLNTSSTSSNSSSSEINSSLDTLNGITVPRFYYGDVGPGDGGFWLLPNLDFSGSQVHWIESPYKINLMGEAFIYMEIQGQNCIDETQPYNVSKFTLETNQTNGVVNAAFAKLAVPATPMSQWFDKESVPYKFYYPPAERIRKLSIKLRYHNGELVDFGVFNFSFMLEFTIMLPQILRETKSVVYPPPMGR